MRRKSGSSHGTYSVTVTVTTEEHVSATGYIAEATAMKEAAMRENFILTDLVVVVGY